MPRNAPPTRTLRNRPDLDQLKRQAKELLDAFRAGDPDAAKEVHAHYRQADAVDLRAPRRAARPGARPRLRQLAQAEGLCRRRHGSAARRGRAQRRSRHRAVDGDARPELVHLDVAENDEHRALHHAVLRPAPGHRPLPDAARRRRAKGHLAASRRDHGVHARRRAWLRRGRRDHRGGGKPPRRGRSAQGAAAPGAAGLMDAFRRGDQDAMIATLGTPAIATGDAAWLRARHADGMLDERPRPREPCRRGRSARHAGAPARPGTRPRRIRAGRGCWKKSCRRGENRFVRARSRARWRWPRFCWPMAPIPTPTSTRRAARCTRRTRGATNR